VPLRHLVLARLVLLPHEARPVVTTAEPTTAEPTMADKSVAVARRAKEAGMRRHSDFFKRTRLRLADITEERALEILDNLIRARDEHDPLFPPRWACVKVEPPPIDGKAIKRELFAASLAAYRRLWHGDDATDGAQDRGATDDGPAHEAFVRALAQHGTFTLVAEGQIPVDVAVPNEGEAALAAYARSRGWR
jgi:hypothetical protein